MIVVKNYSSNAILIIAIIVNEMKTIDVSDYRKTNNNDNNLGTIIANVIGFFQTIATVEAMRIGGWDIFKTNLLLLYNDILNFQKDSKADDEKDDDHGLVAKLHALNVFRWDCRCETDF